MVAGHLDRLISTGRADMGPDPCAMWMSSLDVRTGRYPEDDSRPPNFPKRVYRNIDAPRGCTIYWDQPLLAAAHALSGRIGDARYGRAADEYVRAFLQRCVAPNGVFLWGNHYYWDAFAGCVKRFVGGEEPVAVDMRTEDGSLHEMRPLPPAWECFWAVSPEATAREIRQASGMHLFDSGGGFDRHAGGQPGHAFLESGGILCESLCWLSARAKDRTLAETALRIARFNWAYRAPATDLVPVSPLARRWDHNTCTTEVGLWAGSLLRAGRYSGMPEFLGMAHQAVLAYLRLGWDGEGRRYFGCLNVSDGRPVLGPRETVYQPGDHADLWDPLFPRHDYPLAMAETCVHLYELTGEKDFEEAILRWARMIAGETPARGGRGAYAEQYGRCIHFLTSAARVLNDPSYLDQARSLAEEATTTLMAHGMFRGHPGEERCDAVDGVGLLLLALLGLDGAGEPDGMGFAF